ncbi:Hypothetical predicted protein [Mytilus galloprovincialis]|uniref:Uncharacterized protein n=1 Tax=Mytilus galloprovincialis TaxID=29158 RepID=A0A8B6DFM8_MYTGA|nr:Hypothetical predicted protein [Mytilus galloprovincialis]
MDAISDLSTSIELTINVTDQVKTNIDMLRTHLDIQKCVKTSCSYCPDSLPDEAKRITRESSHRIQHQEKSSRMAIQQPTRTFVAYPFPPAPVQPTSTFAYPFPPAPVQPTSTFAYPIPPAPVQPTSTFAYPIPPAPVQPTSCL